MCISCGCIQLSFLSVGLVLCPGVVFQSSAEWPVASLIYSQVQSGTGSNPRLLTLAECPLCFNVAWLDDYQNQRHTLTLADPPLLTEQKVVGQFLKTFQMVKGCAKLTVSWWSRDLKLTKWIFFEWKWRCPCPLSCLFLPRHVLLTYFISLSLLLSPKITTKLRSLILISSVFLSKAR